MSNENEQDKSTVRRLKLQALRQGQKERPVIEGVAAEPQKGRLLKAVLKRRREQQGAEAGAGGEEGRGAGQRPRLKEIIARRRNAAQDGTNQIERLERRVNRLETALQKAKQQLSDARDSNKENND